MPKSKWSTRHWFQVMLVIQLCATHSWADDSNHVPGYPLQNGSFSSYQGWGRPAKWSLAVEAGKHSLAINPTPRHPHQVGATALVSTQASGQGYVWQTVSLLPGAWRLMVEVSGSKSVKAQLEFSRSTSKQSEIVAVDSKWRTLKLQVPRASGETGIHLRFYSPTGASVRFRRARLEPVRLQSQPIPCENGQLGAIVLPKHPSAAERFAAYELQYFIFRMTDRVPGLQGRDPVFPGRRIELGKVAAVSLRRKLQGKPRDAYLIDQSRSKTTLVGNSGLSTLYAVYDYLGGQGCRWVMPGKMGEVVPRLVRLKQVKSKLESPDFHLVRSFQTGLQQFYPGGGWTYVDVDEYRDWVVRNRLNTIWTGGATMTLGADRGYGWQQNSGHSWNALIAPYHKHFATNPEWYPLVRGKRMPQSDISIKLPNQLCVSNASLRDYTVKQILAYFKANPRSRMFPMNPMDGPNYNCECRRCRALDPPGHAWNQDFSGFPRFPNLKLPPFADRYLNYVNEVTRRVAERHPDKLIEFYNYASRIPPTRERVHPNVAIKFAYHNGREVNVSLLDPHDSIAKKERRWLRGWSNSGTRHFTYYPYTDWEHPDASIHWYFNCNDLLVNLKQEYRCVGVMGETHTTVQADPIWWAIFCKTLWNVKTDYRQVIREVCTAFYGPAARDMQRFYLQMDESVLHREGPRPKDYHPNQRSEFSLVELGQGQELLDRAAGNTKPKSLERRRVDMARFSFALLTLVRTARQPQNQKAIALSKRSRQTVSRLRSQHSILVKQATERSLQQIKAKQ